MDEGLPADDASRRARIFDVLAWQWFGLRHAVRSRWRQIRGRSGAFVHAEESARALQLTRLWETKWPGAIPLGYMMKARFIDRWVRIHSLPESKRYPETQDEYREVIRRHRAVIHDLASGAPIESLVVVIPEYAWRDLASGRMLRNVIGAWPWYSAKAEDGEGDFYFWAASGLSGAQLDTLLTRVADDQGYALVANPGLDWFFCPYDGGADVFLPSAEQVGPFRERYAEWLSPRSDGL